MSVNQQEGIFPSDSSDTPPQINDISLNSNNTNNKTAGTTNQKNMWTNSNKQDIHGPLKPSGPSIASVSLLTQDIESNKMTGIIQTSSEGTVTSDIDYILDKDANISDSDHPSSGFQNQDQIQNSILLSPDHNIPNNNSNSSTNNIVSSSIDSINMSASVSSTSSSYVSASEKPPDSIDIETTSINNNNDNSGSSRISTSNRHSNRTYPISKSLNSTLRVILDHENNDVFIEDDSNDVDNIVDKTNVKNDLKNEKRRSSKRAMSSSLDDYSKNKTRISFSSISKCTTNLTDDSIKVDTLEYDDNEVDTDQPTLGETVIIEGEIPNEITYASLSTTDSITSTPQLKFNSFNPFNNQFSYFSSYKSIPTLTHCKLLANDETIHLLSKYYNEPLPDVDRLFPWLHGIHKLNYGQISFLSNNFHSNNQNKNTARVIKFEKPTSLDEGNNSLKCTENEEEDEDGDNKTISGDTREYSEMEEGLDASEREEEEDEAEDDITRLTRTPDVRFLLPIRSCNTNGETSSSFTSIITESTGLIKGTVSAEDILISYSNIVNLELYLQGILPNEVFKYYHPETIITDCVLTQLIPVFKNLDPEIGINLRNFHIQVSKISHISDFIVYCFNHDEHHFNVNHTTDSFVNNKCRCINLSRLLHIAQMVYQSQHPEIVKKSKSSSLLNNKKYNTFILADPNIDALNMAGLLSIPIIDESLSMKRDDELCSKYDISVFNNWDSNYLYRERLEISKMSTATPLPGNLWLGNITDYECLQIQLSNGKVMPTPTSKEISNMLSEQSNIPLYCNSTNTIVRLTKEDFIQNMTSEDADKLLITFPKIVWKFYIKCVEGARIPTIDQLKLIFENYKECDFINIEFPPSGSLSLADMSDDDILSIVNICKFCYYIVDYDFPGLIYCSDGYTESSLLYLCYLMYSENICLDEAILNLHSQYGRPFFIFKTDYILLTKLETVMKKFSPLVKDTTETKSHFLFETNSKPIRSMLLMPKKRNSVGTFGSSVNSNVGVSVGGNSTSFMTSTGHHVVQLRGSQNAQQRMFNNNNININTINNNIHPRNNANVGNKLSSFKKANPDIEGCFGEVQGSLPSRILKHLYLGSLTHASCIPLLSRLNINYIVSVGEKITWCEAFKHEKEVSESGIEIIKFYEGQIDENTGYELNIKKMLILPNINDDGMGTLIKTIDKTLEFIDECYENEGKVLVHCQVGVSRSATVCIAEVMKRLKLTIARAYMYVRVRRLNVIIQPNLKLMYELFKWEENYLIKKRKECERMKVDTEMDINDRTNSGNTITTRSFRTGSMSSNMSTSSTIFTTHAGKSERSSISTTRGNSISSGSNVAAIWNGNNGNSGSGALNNRLMKSIRSTISEESERNVVIEYDKEGEEEEEEEEDENEDVVGKLDVDEEDDLIPYAAEKNDDRKEVYDVISNNKRALREVDWCILCREIYNLNRAYIKTG